MFHPRVGLSPFIHTRSGTEERQTAEEMLHSCWMSGSKFVIAQPSKGWITLSSVVAITIYRWVLPRALVLPSYSKLICYLAVVCAVSQSEERGIEQTQNESLFVFLQTYRTQPIYYMTLCLTTWHTPWPLNLTLTISLLMPKPNQAGVSYSKVGVSCSYCKSADTRTWNYEFTGQ